MKMHIHRNPTSSINESVAYKGIAKTFSHSLSVIQRGSASRSRIRKVMLVLDFMHDDAYSGSPHINIAQSLKLASSRTNRISLPSSSRKRQSESLYKMLRPLARGMSGCDCEAIHLDSEP